MMKNRTIVFIIATALLTIFIGSVHYNNKVDATIRSAKTEYKKYKKQQVENKKIQLQKIVKSLGDISSFTVFNVENNVSEKMAQGERQTIVFFGDSTTEQNKYTKGKDGHVRLIEKALNSVGEVNIINAGVSGNDGSHLLKRVDADVIRHDPDVVVLNTGINDAVNLSEDDINKNLESIISTIQKKTDAKIIFRTSNPTSDKSINQRITDEINPIANELAKKYGIGYADLYSYFESKTSSDVNSYMNDIYHPNGKGQKVIADYLLKLLLTN